MLWTAILCKRAVLVGLVVCAVVVCPASADWQSGFTGPGALTQWVTSLAMYRGVLIAGGDFYVTQDVTRLNNIAAWDGSRWQPLGGGVRHDGCPGPECWEQVSALTTFDDKLIAGGKFLFAGNHAANNIGSWDGADWAPLGSGTDAWVFCAKTVGQDLYVGGMFETAGGLPSRGIARWDGSQWHALGTGIDGYVSDITVFNGEVIVAGGFSPTGGLPSLGLAAWDGNSWRYLAAPLKSASGLVVYNNALAVSGQFTDPQSGLPYQFGQWDGQVWSPIGPIDPLGRGFSYKLAVFQGRLWSAEGMGAEGSLYVFDGQAWLPIQPNANDKANCILATSSSVFVGGRFTMIGDIPAGYIARWDDTTPVFVEDFQALRDDVRGTTRVSWRFRGRAGADLASIRIERAAEELGPFAAISADLSPQTIRFDDEAVGGAEGPWYRLVGTRRDGTSEVTRPVQSTLASKSGTPKLAILHEGTGPISISYSAGNSHEPYALNVYNVLGRLVSTVATGRSDPDTHLVAWDRSSASGAPVARGVYFVTLRVGGTLLSEKLPIVHAR